MDTPAASSQGRRTLPQGRRTPPTRPVPIAHVPGAVSILSWPDAPGLVWLARYENRTAAIVSLVRRGLATTVKPPSSSRAVSR